MRCVGYDAGVQLRVNYARVVVRVCSADVQYSRARARRAQGRRGGWVKI